MDEYTSFTLFLFLFPKIKNILSYFLFSQNSPYFAEKFKKQHFYSLSNDKTINPSSGQVKFSSFFTSNHSKYQQLSCFEAKTEKNYTLSNLTDLLFRRYLIKNYLGLLRSCPLGQLLFYCKAYSNLVEIRFL